MRRVKRHVLNFHSPEPNRPEGRDGRARLALRRPLPKKISDRPDRAQVGKNLWIDFGQLRVLIAQGGQDFHLLDRIDPKLALKVHVIFQHIFRIAGLLRYQCLPIESYFSGHSVVI